MEHRKWIVLTAVAVLAGGLLLFSRRDIDRPEAVSLTKVGEAIAAGSVVQLRVSPQALEIELNDDRRLVARKESAASLEETLAVLRIDPAALAGVEVAVVRDAGGGMSTASFVMMAVVIVLVALLITRSGSLGMSRHGRSKAQRRVAARETVTFADAAGVEEAKEELVEVVEFLRDPTRFRRLGARIPRGVLLVGPPGTGKTLLARAVAGEAGVPFFSTSGSEFVEMYVGVGASRARDLFRQAKKSAPAIVFIDEIDAVGRRRGQSHNHEERDQTLNQLLVEMDGFDSDATVVVIAATNRVDVLDAALLRPGRFDRRIMVSRPDVAAREAILDVHTRDKPLSTDVDLRRLARSIPGFAGADISNLVNEAAILAARRSLLQIGRQEFADAVERIIAGPLRKNRILSDRERRVVAYHEAGHAVAMHVLPECAPVQKVSIVARGEMGGYTLAVPEHETILHDRSKLMADLAGLLGGRAAEEIAIGEITTGAANDMQRATSIARDMVMRYGMSANLGPLVYGGGNESLGEGRVSERVAADIDHEVQHIVAEAHALARSLLKQHRRALERVAAALIEHEVLDAESFAAICLRAGSPRAEHALAAPVTLSTARRPDQAPIPDQRRAGLARRTGRALVGAGALASLVAVTGGIRVLEFVLRRSERPNSIPGA